MGVCAAISWAGAFYYLATRTNGFIIFDTGFLVNGEAFVTLATNPYFVDIEKLFETILDVTIVSAILATVAQHARKIASNAAWNRSPFGASHFLGRVMPSWIVLDLKIEQCQRRDGNSLHAGAHEITSFCNNPVPYTLRLIMLKNTAHLIHIIRLCENYWTLAGSLAANFNSLDHSPKTIGNWITAVTAEILGCDFGARRRLTALIFGNIEQAPNALHCFFLIASANNFFDALLLLDQPVEDAI